MAADHYCECGEWVRCPAGTRTYLEIRRTTGSIWCFHSTSR